ncbi:MAG: hypothetical protein RL138_1154 [Bacteroidota bacterium]|jgi:hypothetical protein
MSIQTQIETYIESLVQPKQTELRKLFAFIKNTLPQSNLSFLDGRDEKGKVVTNPNIGFGECVLNYADGSSRAFYKIGISATSKGLSIYIMGLADKNLLRNKLEDKLGKATITGYCISFKKLEDINQALLKEVLLELF